jgi:general secretion pathway protein E
MVLVTGPTGSGKTTTLYAAISEINHGDDKIITIEDPVEYQLPGVLQIPINEKKGLTFARGLRSILRHDPDKIMVGRDPRSRDGADRRAGGAHRPPRVHDRPREQRLRRDRPLHAHGRRSVQLRRR